MCTKRIKVIHNTYNREETARERYEHGYEAENRCFRHESLFDYLMMIHSYLHSPFFAARFRLVPMLHLIFNLHTYSLVSALYWELSYYFSLAFEVVAFEEVRGVRMKTGWLGLCRCGRVQGMRRKGLRVISICYLFVDDASQS